MQSFLRTEMHPLRRIAQLTPRYSGSDLVEVCKLAARHCVLEHVKCSGQINAPPAVSVSASRNPSASLEGKGTKPRKGGMSWSVLHQLMQWQSSPPAEDAEKGKAPKGEGSKGVTEHNGDVFLDAESFTFVETPKVSPQAQLSEAALIKCVSQVWWCFSCYPATVRRPSMSHAALVLCETSCCRHIRLILIFT